MTTTPADLINLALLDSGVIGQGQSASGEDVNNAFTRLNMMRAQWNRKRWLVFALVDTAKVATGAQSYTIGIGGDFNIPRPDRIEDGNYVRILTSGVTQQTDYPLKLINSHEDYNQIIIKSMGTFPQAVFYDSQYPLGVLRFWPVSQASTYELHILTKTPLNGFSSLAAPVNLPDEYQAAILYNLQVRLRAAYRLAPDPIIIGLAKDALNVIRNSNTQIPSLRMPAAVLNNGKPYNIYSDTP